MVENKTILFSSFRQANTALKQAASFCKISKGASESISPSIGSLFTTPWSFIASEWELWGDGRELIGDTERILGILTLLEKYKLDVSMGTAMQIASLVKRGYTTLLRAENMHGEGFTETENSIVSLVKDYSEFLKKWDFAELTEAMDAIKPHIQFSNVLIDANCILEDPFKTFFESCEIAGNTSGDFVIDLDPSIDLEILRAEGTSAVEKMVYDECEQSVLENGFKKIAIVGQDPSSQFEALSQDFCELGFKCTKIDSLGFSKTFFGRFLLGVCRLLALSDDYGLSRTIEVEAFDWVSVATDIAMNPYSAIAPFDKECLYSKTVEFKTHNLNAKDMNSIWRADRTTTVENAIKDLHEISPSFTRIKSLFSGTGDPFASIGAFERIARAVFDESKVQLEINAIQDVLSTMESIAKFNLPAFYVPLIVQAMATNDIETFVADTRLDNSDALEISQVLDVPEIIFLSKSAIQTMPAGTFDEVIFSDVSDAFLNAKSHIDSTAHIAEKLGLPTHDSTMEKNRHVFAAALNASGKKFVCVFPAHDKNSQDSFTSFCFDEMIDGLFDGKIGPQDVVRGEIDQKSNNTNQAISFNKMGEEKAQETLGRMFTPPETVEAFALVERGKLEDLSLLDFMNCSPNHSGSTLPVISPSSVETYLACPYKWFIDYVIKPSNLDESFSHIERGTFAHELLRQFYDAWKEVHGNTFFDENESSEVAALYTGIAKNLLESQTNLAPNSGRFVPSNLIELEEASKVIESTLESIFRLNALPKSFELAASEYSISPYGENPSYVEYADFFINGKVDRIDSCKTNGEFYVLDYKGSLKGHNAGLDSFELMNGEDGQSSLNPHVLPEHVQVLIYASVLSKLGVFGEQAKGAFYTSYRPKSNDPLMVGSYESLAKELGALSNKASSVGISFEDFLSLVEDALRVRLNELKISDIQENPASDSACKYCDYIECERRLA